MGIRFEKVSIVFQSFLCFILLFMPLALTQITSIYTVETPSHILYKYTNFDFSVVAIPVIFLGVFKLRKSKSIHFFYFTFMLLLINAFLPYDDNVFKTANFEMFLIMLQAAALNYIVFSFDIDSPKSKTDRAVLFLKVYFILCFLSTLLRLALGMSTDGRFGAIGLSVGGTGYFSAIMLLYLIYCEKYSFFNLFVTLCAFISLVLSGQRTCLFIFLVLILPYCVNIFFSTTRHTNNDIGRKKMQLLFIVMMSLLVFFTLILLLLVSMGMQLPGLSFVERVFDAVDNFLNGSLSQEGSVGGRFESIEAGLGVWVDNPIGIPNDFYSLQSRMCDYNYPTFPHCTLLDIILLWTLPVAIYVSGYCIKLWFILAKHHDELQWIMLFILIMSIIWGSPFTGIAQLFIELFFITLASIRVNTKYETFHIRFTFGGKKL